MERTKGKLKCKFQSKYAGGEIHAYIDNEYICTTSGRAKANAEHLVRCWNAFEEGGSLSKPLERLSKLKEQTFGPIAAELAGIIDDFQQIIAQAEDN